MKTTITISGKLVFDVENKTKKHILQSSWKKHAMILFDGDICDYYAWFLNKRFNLNLNKPLRGAHLTLINDSHMDLTKNGEISDEEVENKWVKVKNKYDGKEFDVTLSLEPKMNSEYIWLTVPHENRSHLQIVRDELGLGKPFFGMHMTIGRKREGFHGDHFDYIHNLMINGYV